jgi:hypothetical protein
MVLFESWKDGSRFDKFQEDFTLFTINKKAILCREG